MVRVSAPTQRAIEMGKRLRGERKRQRKTQRSVADAVGCAQQTVLDLERGSVEYSRYLPAIAEHLGVSVAWLQSGEGPQDQPEGSGKPLPIVGWEFFTDLANKHTVVTATEWIDGCPVRHTGNACAIFIDEAAAFAMKGEVFAGEMLIVDMERSDAGLVIGMMAGWTRAEIRELLEVGGRYYVQSSNPAIPQSLTPVSVYTDRDEYRAALQVPGQETLPFLCLGRGIFKGKPL